MTVRWPSGGASAGVLALALVALGACHPAREQALEGLRSEDAGVRAAAAVRLAGVGDAACLPALRRAVGDPDGEVRRSAIASLVALGDRAGADAIREALEDRETQVRRAAVRALADLRVRRATDDLLDRLADPNLVVRRGASKALADLGVPRRRQVGRLAERQRKELRARMAEEGEGAIAAARLLLADDDAAAARTLLEVLERHLLEPSEARSLARSLGAVALPAAAAARVAALAPELQAELVAGAAESSRTDREAVLVAALAAPAAVVRRAAAAGLGGERRSAGAERALCAALRDADADVAVAAADTLAARAGEACAGEVGADAPLGVLARRAKGAPALVPALARRLAAEPGDAETWRVASDVPDAAVAEALAAVLTREVQARGAQAARWIPASVWTAMAPGDEAEGTDDALPRPGQHSRDAIAQLLRRFPLRGEGDELWPTDSDPERVRTAALAAARAAREPAAQAAIVARAAELAVAADPALRRAAAAILAERAEAAVPEALAVDPEPAVRADVAQAFAVRGAVAWLERLVKDDDETVRRAACAGVAERRVRVAPAVLRDAFRRDGSEECLRAVAGALGADAHDELGDVLRKDESTVGPDVRVAALDALGRVGTRRDVALVATALDAGDPGFRAAAAAALARLGGQEARTKLEEHAEDFDAGVRRAVAAALAVTR